MIIKKGKVDELNLVLVIKLLDTVDDISDHGRDTWRPWGDLDWE
jgi:hypothetical protein